MYIEASSPRQLGDYAKLHSPPLKFLGNMCLQFYYHMFGATTGSLKVSINERQVFSESGDKGLSWNKVSINVSAIVGSHRVTNIFVFLLNLREFKQRRFRATHVNRKWTFCTLELWFWTNFWANRLFKSKVKTLSNTNLVASRHIKGEKSSLSADVRDSKTLLLKLSLDSPKVEKVEQDNGLEP